MSNLQEGLPIAFEGNNPDMDGTIVVGYTTGCPQIVTRDEDNGVYEITFDGIVFDDRMECVVKSLDGNNVEDFEIAGLRTGTGAVDE